MRKNKTRTLSVEWTRPAIILIYITSQSSSLPQGLSHAAPSITCIFPPHCLAQSLRAQLIEKASSFLKVVFSTSSPSIYHSLRYVYFTYNPQDIFMYFVIRIFLHQIVILMVNRHQLYSVMQAATSSVPPGHSVLQISYRVNEHTNYEKHCKSHRSGCKGRLG